MKLQNLLPLILTGLALHTSLASAADQLAVLIGGSSQAVIADLTTGTLGTPVSVGNNPRAVVISPDGETAYVMNSGQSGFGPNPSFPGSVTVIDIATGTVTATISFTSVAVGNFLLSGIANAPDGTKIYVTGRDTSSNGYLIPISTATNTLGTSIGLGNLGAGKVAITPDGATALVLNNVTARVLIVDLTNGTFGTVNFGGGSSINSISITPDGATAYFGVSNLQIYSLDLATLGIRTAISTSYVPNDISISADGSTLYATCPGGGNTILLPVDLATQTQGTPINVTPSQPFNLVIAPDGNTALLTTSSGYVLPVDLVTGTRGTPIAFSASDLAIVPDQAPTARFTFATGAVNSPTTFDASTSTTPVGTIVEYDWDFGDGQIGITSTPTVAHSYGVSGGFNVTLTVINSAGTSTTQTFTGDNVLNNGSSSATVSHQVTVNTAAAAHQLFGSGSCPNKALFNFTINQQVVKFGVYRGTVRLAGLIHYSDRAGKFSFIAKVSSLTVNGNQAQFSGTGLVGRTPVTYTVNVTGNGTGTTNTFSLSISNGYTYNSNTATGVIKVK